MLAPSADVTLDKAGAGAHQMPIISSQLQTSPVISGDESLPLGWAFAAAPLRRQASSILSGMAVHTGARIGALAGPGEVLASRTVRDLSAGSGLRFESLGVHQLKGLPEEVDVYRVTTPTSGLTP